MNAKVVFVLHLVLHLWNATGVYAVSEGQEQKDDRSPWYIGLFWNLLGYATVIVPGAIVIRLVKNSNFNESGGQRVNMLLIINNILIVRFPFFGQLI